MWWADGGGGADFEGKSASKRGSGKRYQKTKKEMFKDKIDGQRKCKYFPIGALETALVLSPKDLTRPAPQVNPTCRVKPGVSSHHIIMVKHMYAASP